MGGAAWWKDRRRLLAVVGGAVVLAIIGTVAMIHRSPSRAAEATPTSVASSGADSRTTTTTPSTPSASATGRATTSSHPTASRSVSPYCQKYLQILAGDQDTDQDEDSLNLDQLSDKLAHLIDKYTRASQLAPTRLRPDYSRVIARLKSMKSAVDARDIDRIKAMLGQLDSLNDAMDQIQQVSRTVCG